MLNKIIKLFFVKEKVASETILTVRRKNNVINLEQRNESSAKKSDNQVDTCLSRYFRNHKGLNLTQRGFRNVISENLHNC